MDGNPKALTQCAFLQFGLCDAICVLTRLREEKIFDDDDPRWIDAERGVSQAWDTERDIAVDLLNVRPTTMAGVLALLQYANAADTDGEMWPCDLVSDDETKTRSWHYFLIEALAETLPTLAGIAA